ncbi:secreted RxLR effector protein 161-like [Benincasa hispida]|uniref:secreted RxLR effector protein 161-like n=1 Tax=Benincasa hispida TaxID=102211 RepID=UPI0019002DAD|nr:secreted RxLR effector protein 161-like [Benincasa hispida]
MVSTRPDIAYATSLVSRYMANLGKRHWKTTKWIMRYLKGTSNSKLMYQQLPNSKPEPIGYVNSDYVGDLDKRRSLSGYIFLYGRYVLSWKATLQSVVALSTTEAEFIALSEAVKEGLWLKGLLCDLGIKKNIIEEKQVEVLKLHTSENAFDMLTKTYSAQTSEVP